MTLQERIIGGRGLHCAAVAAYTCIFGGWFFPVVATGRLLALNDGLIEALPVFHSPVRLWTTDLYAGFPAAADPIAQSWYPLTALAKIPQGWNLFVVLGYVLLSSFTYGYVWTITGSRFGGFVSGLVFGLSGMAYGTVRLGHITVLHTLVWMPLVLWALERLRHPHSVRWLLIGPLAVANAFLAGHPQVFLYVMTMLVVYVVVSAVAETNDRWFFLARATWIFAVGVGLTAVQLLPSAELASRSLRPRMTLAEATSHALDLSASVLVLFFYPGPENRHGVTAYMGLVTLFLVVVALAATHGAWRTRFWAAIAVVAFMLALGNATPLGALVFRLPLYSMFRIPARHLYELTFALSVLAGIGAAAIQRRAVTPSRLHRLAIGALAVIAAGALSAAVLARAEFAPVVTDRLDTLRWPSFSNPGVTLPLLWLFALLGVLIFSNRRALSGWWAMAIISILLFDLAGAGWRTVPKLSWPTPAALHPPVHGLRYRELLAAGYQRMLPVLGAQASRDAFPPNMSRFWSIPSVSGYGPLISARLSQLLEMRTDGSMQDTWSHPRDRRLDILAVRYVFLPAATAEGQFGAGLVAARWKPVERVGETAILENLRALPRAWLVSSLRIDSPEAILRALRTSLLSDRGYFDPRRTALVEEPVDLAPTPDDGESTANIVGLSGTTLEIRTHSRNPGFLVISDASYPGWRAQIDGRPTRLFTANYVLRGLVVPAGDHVVHCEFHPWTTYFGGGISLLAVLMLGFAWKLREE